MACHWLTFAFLATDCVTFVGEHRFGNGFVRSLCMHRSADLLRSTEPRKVHGERFEPFLMEPEKIYAMSHFMQRGYRPSVLSSPFMSLSVVTTVTANGPQAPRIVSEPHTTLFTELLWHFPIRCTMRMCSISKCEREDCVRICPQP
ncbi:hypothetical protein BKA83DRAFT_4278664 [Pisolithus microcarpus]|nr:hypothetical protein BKA83DRAFT_4278664 [Pisolithus microcarpus]